MTYKDKIKTIDKQIEKIVSIKYYLILLLVLLLWFILLQYWEMVFVFIIQIIYLIKIKNKYKKHMVEG